MAVGAAYNVCRRNTFSIPEYKCAAVHSKLHVQGLRAPFLTLNVRNLHSRRNSPELPSAIYQNSGTWRENVF